MYQRGIRAGSLAFTTRFGLMISLTSGLDPYSLRCITAPTAIVPIMTAAYIHLASHPAVSVTATGRSSRQSG